jgi:peptidoglycan/LPS O-acetylase OafA/YrhL
MTERFSQLESLPIRALSAENTEPTPPVNPRPASFYRPELDALRFFAFLSVFMFHSVYHPATYFAERHVPVWISRIASAITGAGGRGVDLFFVLSAYLITELLLQEKSRLGALDVKSFYVRRILRIWPLYYTFVILAAVVPFLNPWHNFTLRYVVPFMLLAGNWSTIVFGPTGSLAEPLWSVSVEEQFYLIWAPIVAKLSSRQITIAAGIMITLANAVRVVEVVRHATGWQIWANTLTHLDAMAGGILVAVLLRGGMPQISLWARFAIIGAGAAALAAANYLGGDASVSAIAVILGYPVVAFSCTVILVGVLGMQMRISLLRYLGKLSYGLYVYHLTGIRASGTLLPLRWGVAGIGIRAALALALTIAISAVSYRFFEAPFLKLKRRFTYVASRPV